MGFRQWAEMGSKVGFGLQKCEKWIEAHFSPTLNPFRDCHENLLFTYPALLTFSSLN